MKTWISRHTINIYCIFSESILAECFGVGNDYGIQLWTAGQRTDPTSESTFIWRVPSQQTCNEPAVYLQTYTNWKSGEPTYGFDAACMDLIRNYSYKWNDAPCDRPECSVCELDM